MRKPGCHLVCHAGDGGRYGHLCGIDDDSIYKANGKGDMCMSRIITIGREFGSGGRELGRRLAEELGYAYYDQ